MKNHMKMHSTQIGNITNFFILEKDVQSETNLQCKVCHTKFTRKDSLQRHEMTHCKAEKDVQYEINFKCELCPTNFTRKDNLLKHVKTQHKAMIPLSDTDSTHVKFYKNNFISRYTPAELSSSFIEEDSKLTKKDEVDEEMDPVDISNDIVNDILDNIENNFVI